MQASHHAKIRLTSLHVFEQIAEMICASSIMTSRNEFEYCKSDDSLTEKLRVMKKRRLDVIPIIQGDDLDTAQISRYVEQGDMEKKIEQGCRWCEEASTEIGSCDYLSYDLQMKDVISRFSKRAANSKIPFFLIDSTKQIVGLITVADLDKTAAKMYFFAILCELELSLLKIISGHYKGLKEICSCKYCREQRGKRAEKEFSGDTLEEYHYLNLTELLHIVGESENIRPAHDRIKSVLALDRCDDIIRLRNAIAHPKPLVWEEFPLDKLVKVHDIIRNLILILKNDANGQPQ